MTINRGYVANHKIWDRIGRITPNTEYSKSERPHFESMPAPWLPVQRFDKTFEAYFVISAGKVVAEDREGFLVPAGLRKKFNVASAATNVLVYTAADVTENVIDLTTGVAVTAAVDYDCDEIRVALQERGLLAAGDDLMEFISKPVGVASYNYYKAAGPDFFNPTNQFEHNFRLQASTAITCDYVITLPVVPASVTDEIMDGDLVNEAGSIDWTTGRTGGWFGSKALNGLVKYSSLIADDAAIVGYVITNAPVAAVTADSPFSVDDGGLTAQKSSVGAVTAAGDWFLDTEAGILFLYEAAGTAIPSPMDTSSVLTYSHYASAVSGAGNTFACATGNLNYGDFLTYDASSNLIKATLDIANAEGHSALGVIYDDTDPDYGAGDDDVISLQLEQAIDNHMLGIVGQVIGTTVFPRTALERVRTAYEGLTPKTAAPYLQGEMRTPGSATGGRSDQLVYSGAAEKMVIVNLTFR